MTRCILRIATLACLLLLTAPIVWSQPSQSHSVPAALSILLQSRYPNAVILVSSACKLREPPADAFGLLVKASTLKAMIAWQEAGIWSVSELPLPMQNSHGSAKDFLADFRGANGGLREPAEIRCTSPQTDPDMNSQVNGQFVAAFAEQLGPDAKHLCFQSSSTYNDWNCFSLDPVSRQPVETFVQLNAD